jgi:hypothetical protein
VAATSALLRTLDAEDRLAPVDRGKIDAIAEMFAALP